MTGDGTRDADGDPGSGTEDGDRPSVLVVDDEARVVQAFELWLDDYDVVTATDGSEALERMHGGIDVVLLDRHMPGLSGDEVLDRIRETGYGCRVAMVTAVDPDFDIVDMPFDHYVSKPVDAGELQEVVDRLLGVDEYDRRLNDLYAVTQKVATLEAEKTRGQLQDSDRYADLLDEQDRLQSEVDDLVASLDAPGMERLFDVTGE
jgi:CheY-like chemotaxis protein